MNDAFERLALFQTNHLILLVGTNPLPNFVAAQLLLKQGGVIHLICTPETAEIAKQLKKQLETKKLACNIYPDIKQNRPSSIFESIRSIGIGTSRSVGLHYTGGTKAMAVHAYRAIKDVCPKAICSYLDALELKMIIDDGMGDGRDAEIIVRDVVKLKLQEMIALHNINLASQPKRQPILTDVAHLIKQIMETKDGYEAWRNWTKNLRSPNNLKKFKNKTELKKTPAPPCPEVRKAFGKLGANGETLEAWLQASKSFEDDIEKFARWLDGEWLESYVLNCLIQNADVCKLNDWGMDLKSRESKFQFDVAAIRGYQLFAISCTTSKDTDLCKSKLFEAYVRAKQMGGDEARVGLVCFYPDAQRLLSNFINEWKYPRHSVRVFGADDLPHLPERLQEWINSDGF